MSKKKKLLKALKFDSASFKDPGQTGIAVGSLAGSTGHYEHVLFIDASSEISDESVERLEEAGFIVVPIVGEPGRCIYQATIYKP